MAAFDVLVFLHGVDLEFQERKGGVVMECVKDYLNEAMRDSNYECDSPKEGEPGYEVKTIYRMHNGDVEVCGYAL
ncbi:hypothetical protein Tco_0051447 [Tanacetum coccineum]